MNLPRPWPGRTASWSMFIISIRLTTPRRLLKQAKAQASFYDSLRHVPNLELRLAKLLPLQDGTFRAKGDKAMFSAELVYQCARGHFDTAIVLTDDTEYALVLQMMKELGRLVEIGLFKDNQPGDLMRASDRMINLTEVLNKFPKKIFPAPEPKSEPNEEPEPDDNIGNRVTAPPPRKPSPKKPKKAYWVTCFRIPDERRKSRVLPFLPLWADERVWLFVI